MAYACHNTTLNGDFYEITGDYAGFAEAKVEAEHPGATALFLALCGGDQNPNPRGTLALAEQHGGELAGEVERVLGGSLKTLNSQRSDRLCILIRVKAATNACRPSCQTKLVHLVVLFHWWQTLKRASTPLDLMFRLLQLAE